MVRGSLAEILVPLGRIAAGFIAAFLLAFLGDLLARLFNLSIGYPWDPVVHKTFLYVGIGLGAGIGAYAAWVNPRHGWRWLLVFGLTVLAGGVVGAYLGRIYGPGPDSTYWWSRFATDRTVYWVAAGLSTGIATIWGLADQIYSRSRSRSHTGVTPMSTNV